MNSVVLINDITLYKDLISDRIFINIYDTLGKLHRDININFYVVFMYGIYYGVGIAS